MNPVYFGLVYGIIFILLHFARTVKHHVAGRDDGLVFLAPKMKIGLSRGNVEQLEINPPPGAVGGQARFRVQVVRAAAADDQRTALILEIHQGMV